MSADVVAMAMLFLTGSAGFVFLIVTIITRATGAATGAGGGSLRGVDGRNDRRRLFWG